MRNEQKSSILHNATISIGARTFNIYSYKTSEDVIFSSNPDVASYIDHATSKIVIRDDGDLSIDSYEELVIHEIMHAIVKNTGLDQCLREAFDEEFLVSTLAPRIHELIKNLMELTHE